MMMTMNNEYDVYVDDDHPDDHEYDVYADDDHPDDHEYNVYAAADDLDIAWYLYVNAVIIISMTSLSTGLCLC